MCLASPLGLKGIKKRIIQRGWGIYKALVPKVLVGL